MKKLNKKDKLFLAAMVMVSTIGITMPVLAKTETAKPDALNSQGVMWLKGADEEFGTDDDIIFDANDLYWLYEFCK